MLDSLIFTLEALSIAAILVTPSAFAMFACFRIERKVDWLTDTKYEELKSLEDAMNDLKRGRADDNKEND